MSVLAESRVESRESRIVEPVLPKVEAAPTSRPMKPSLPNIQRVISADQICVLTFDRPDSSANVFDEATLRELDGHLDFILSELRLKGVVLTSAKPAIFIAGADLHTLARLAPADLLGLIELGQTVFNRLATLPVPTVAAIHGACVGGGYEVCLACDYRIASDDRATKIGLPETQLGILPAWGGSTRLPRLIGLPRALDVILGGKTLAARPALKLGLVDALAPKEKLVELACRRILSAGLALRQRPRKFSVAVANNAFAAKLIAARARNEIMKKARGHYPAVLKALEVVTKAVTRTLGESLDAERHAIVELSQTEAGRNLVRAFFLQEWAKKLKVGQASSLSPSESKTSETGKMPVLRSAVIGAGVMGAGIAQWLSARGLPVMLRDISAEQVAKGMAGIARLYADGVRRHLFTPVEARAG
ncbi:MAG: enoyl-CoA hydratase/isomerase family protein, partial [Verrucomicrobia bacterium]|nr:enoyl-CoA hydratase/isomerase family protein [Verrucomicrobiota bacterium]